MLFSQNCKKEKHLSFLLGQQLPLELQRPHGLHLREKGGGRKFDMQKVQHSNKVSPQRGRNHHIY